MVLVRVKHVKGQIIATEKILEKFLGLEILRTGSITNLEDTGKFTVKLPFLKSGMIVALKFWN